MSARAIGELVAGAAPTKARRTFQPVRRNSYHRHEREHRIWHPIGSSKTDARRFMGALIKAAEIFDDQTKKPGDRMGAIGLTGLKVLKTLCRIVCYRTGRLEPSIAWIQAQTKLARGTVVRALARLKEHGFLDWLRRTEPLDNDGAGPQVRQITNAYWFALRGTALAIVKRLMGKKPPLPGCEEHRRHAAAAETEAMLDGVSAEEQARFIAGAGTTGDVLAALGRALERSASSNKSQNPAEEGRI
ncbi:MAG: hypothetical protein ACK4K7_06625 [Allosphingosinicella sp.]|uniref:hypothetical protein n=1 Tax=Allosphingosinicella sp. TaxID=2823234 RepID=UPI0039296F83